MLARCHCAPPQTVLLTCDQSRAQSVQYSTQSMERFMAFMTADVVPNPGGKEPFKVVFKQGESVIAEWDVKTKEEGEEQIVELVRDAVEDDDEGEDDDK